MMATPTTSIGFENTVAFYYIIRTVIGIAALVIAYYLGDYVGKIINKAARVTGKNLRAPNTTRTILKSLFIFIAIIIIIAEFNIDLWPLLTSLGIAGIIIGLALQTPLSNFFSGIMVIITDAVNEGDAIDVSGISGTVSEVRFNHTLIDTWDGKRVHIPNSAPHNESFLLLSFLNEATSCHCCNFGACELHRRGAVYQRSTIPLHVSSRSSATC
jgi:small-conductance mechanosensitive channel